MNKEQIKLLNSKLENSYYDYIETDDINILAYMTEIIYALVKEYKIPICEFENIRSEKRKDVASLNIFSESSGGCNLNDIEKMKKAKIYVHKMAEGIDPITDIKIENNNILNNTAIKNCLFYIERILDEVIKNNGIKSKNGTKIKKEPFYITEEQIKKVIISELPISISVFCRNVNKVIDTDVYKKFDYKNVIEWLIDNGFLKYSQNKDGSYIKRITETAKFIGMMEENRVNMTGKEYMVILYNRKAQQFILDNIYNIINSKNIDMFIVEEQNI